MLNFDVMTPVKGCKLSESILCFFIRIVNRYVTYNLRERAVKSKFNAVIQFTLLACIIERFLLTSRVLPGDYSIFDFCTRDNTNFYSGQYGSNDLPQPRSSALSECF